MDKNQIISEFSIDYQNLSESNKDTFSRIVNRLLAVNYICGGREKDKKDYYFISANEQLFKNMFYVLDYRFYINKGDLVAYIDNAHNYNHLTLKQLQSIVLLILRKLYFQKMQELQDTEFVSTSLGELHGEIEATGLYDKRIKKGELKELYQFLSKYSICEKIGDLEDDETRLIIYPTINYILPITKINEIIRRIDAYKKGDLSYEDIDESEID